MRIILDMLPGRPAGQVLTVLPDSQWAHRNGNRYRVLFLANGFTDRPEKYPIQVIYQGSNGRVWARSLDDWHRSMTPIVALPDIGTEEEKRQLHRYLDGGITDEGDE